jgi:NAD(P)-dependent dehydrogenase (short-subunit alcohol dehydrogenase family)
MTSLEGTVALVSGATRGAGRAIAIELAAAGAKVYATGRSTRTGRSTMDRPETIEETAEIITKAGGKAVPIRVDHAVPEEVAKLVEWIAGENDGRIDILVNDIWGGDPLAQWGVPFWQHNLEGGLSLVRNAVDTHIITSWYVAPWMVKQKHGLIIEVTDGITSGYRGSLFYDLAKANVNRLAMAQAVELKAHNVAVVAVSPGFLRSEAMLDHFGVTEATWREAIAKDPHFAESETPHFIGRAVAALASDPNIMTKSGTAAATWNLAKEYGFKDVDGSRPDWGRYAREKLGMEMG